MITSEIYKRFKEGNYSKDDFEAIKKAMQNREGKTQLDILMKEDWQNLNKSKVEVEKDLNHILHKIHYKINEQKQDNFLAVKKAWNLYSKAAGVLLIIILTSILFFKERAIPFHQHEIAYSEIIAPPGSRSKFQLPDGSTGWLNTGSSLKYQIPFNNNRHVELHGEAFFNIVHNEDSPFTVKFSGLNVNVLGTEFNVMAYDDDQVSEVILVDGKVEITDINGDFSTKLDIDQKFTLNSNKKTASIEEIDANNYVAWKEGKLIFRNEPLPDVFKRLGRWYNVEFVLADKELYEQRYRATFVDEQLDEVLRLLSLSSPINYKIEKRKMNSEHEFIKKRIIVTYNKN